MKDITTIKTFGELKKSGYKSKSIKVEMRDNLLTRLKNNETSFDGIIGFDDTGMHRIPNVLVKTRILRALGITNSWE